MKKRRVAVFGGAFDPPTVNHMMGAAECIHSGVVDEVMLVPCGPRPDKPSVSNAVDRYIMVQIAVNTHFSPDMPIRVADIETLEEEAMATYDTLTALRKAYPDCEFSFVIGTDWLQPGTDLTQWTSKDFDNPGQVIVTGDKLVSEFDFLVIRRPGYDVKDLSSYGKRMKWLEMPEGIQLLEGNLSSTEIRKRVAASFQEVMEKRRDKGKDVEEGLRRAPQFVQGMVTPAVLSYIARHKLYLKPMEITSRVSRKDSFTDRRKRVGIFGGAFDPPTMSHMMGFAEIVNCDAVDEAVIVPCGPRPDKPQLRPPLVRYTMCQIAVASWFSASMPVSVSKLEVFEPEMLPTYDALCAMRGKDPDADFVFVIGSDWLQPGTDIRKWTSKDPNTGEQIVTGHKLLEEFDFLVIKRPGYEVEDLSTFGPRMKWLVMPYQMKHVESNISSSEVRKRASTSSLSLIDGIVPPAVYSFVKREGLYRPPNESKQRITDVILMHLQSWFSCFR
jgi:nicotinate (nicotinamide) nucleotide adenylyltransferase